uniref:Uncharacterized protein n=1 Tax=Tanacetum cinerariifolium TaxID=118510 RepID=A0A699I4L8_TANCI|nr:hypothetical protein [Tanacetum cinerariifolium]
MELVIVIFLIKTNITFKLGLLSCMHGFHFHLLAALFPSSASVQDLKRLLSLCLYLLLHHRTRRTSSFFVGVQDSFVGGLLIFHGSRYSNESKPDFQAMSSGYYSSLLSLLVLHLLSPGHMVILRASGQLVILRTFKDF